MINLPVELSTHLRPLLVTSSSNFVSCNEKHIVPCGIPVKPDFQIEASPSKFVHNLQLNYRFAIK